MIEKSLTRRDRGRLAEAIVKGLYSDPSEEVLTVIHDHVQERYPDAGETIPVRIQPANVSSRKWMDVIPPRFPPEIGWRPDCVLMARWESFLRPENPREDRFWERNPVPRLPEAFDGGSQRLRCMFTVYHPIEVKSGGKKTLTKPQARAIPAVVEHVDHVHPLIAKVELEELPDTYYITVEEFSTSDWGPSDGSSGRYR